MKKILMLILACVMLLSLCACGGEDPADTSAPTQTQEQTTAPSETENDETTVPSTGETPSVGETTLDDVLELVLSYKDQPIEDLIAVIGEPEYSDYAPSCLGDGEDGMLYYDGFIVYTYRENGVETVYDVE